MSQVKIAYKYRLYPNQEQKVLLHKNMGCFRFVYNQMPTNRKALYEEYKKVKEEYDNYGDYLIKNDLYELKPSHLKKEFDWLKEVDSLALCHAELNLNTAYPKLKNKMKLKYHRPIPKNSIIKSATIERKPYATYYISILVEQAIKNMVKKHKLAKAIHEVSWYRFREMLAYKCEWYGRKLIVAPKKYASSQLCSNCETKNPKAKNLSVRECTCDYCHMTHDRDINASKNLLKLANSCQ